MCKCVNTITFSEGKGRFTKLKIDITTKIHLLQMSGTYTVFYNIASYCHLTILIDFPK